MWRCEQRGRVSSAFVPSAFVLTTSRAKRYERMLKHHGIHPNGGPLDDPISPTKKSAPIAKASKKRKHEDPSGPIKQDGNEERKAHSSKRPRFEHQLEVKQEPIQMGFPPYVFHTMMLPPGSHMPRHMPPFMHPVIPNSLSHPSQVAQPAFPMIPSIQNNPQFFIPPNQMQSFPGNQNPPALCQEPNQSAPFEDFCSQDFGTGSFETLLHGEQIDPLIQKDSPLYEQLPATVPQELQQTSKEPKAEMLSCIKAEPSQPTGAPLLDPGSHMRQPSPPTSASETKDVISFKVATLDADAEMKTGAPVATASGTANAEADNFRPVKRETKSCIFISD